MKSTRQGSTRLPIRPVTDRYALRSSLIVSPGLRDRGVAARRKRLGFLKGFATSMKEVLPLRFRLSSSDKQFSPLLNILPC